MEGLSEHLVRILRFLSESPGIRNHGELLQYFIFRQESPSNVLSIITEMQLLYEIFGNSIFDDGRHPGETHAFEEHYMSDPEAARAADQGIDVLMFINGIQFFFNQR